jgi:hypothetical protein
VRKSLVLCVLIAAAGSLVLTGTSLAADTVIATVPDQTPVDAYDGRVVWSLPSPSGYQLAEYRDGRVQTLAVAPHTEPFDVDLGPDRHGRPVAVYSRCRLPLTDFRSLGRRGCDVYLYNFVSRTERALARANSSADESAPAIWRRRIAFVRTHPARGPLIRRYLYWRRIPGGGRSHLLHRGRYGRHADSVDIRGRRVVFIATGEYGGGDVRVAYTNGGGRLLSVIPESGAAAVEYRTKVVSAARGFAYWLVTRPPPELPALGEIRRHRFAGRRDQRAAVAIDEAADAFAQDGAVSYYALPSSGERCVAPCAHDIHRLDGVRFERARPLELR